MTSPQSRSNFVVKLLIRTKLPTVMKKLNLITFLFILFSTLAFGQQLTQTVRGTIQDADNQLSLIGASVVFS